jgi:hypothetical protein
MRLSTFCGLHRDTEQLLIICTVWILNCPQFCFLVLRICFCFYTCTWTCYIWSVVLRKWNLFMWDFLKSLNSGQAFTAEYCVLQLAALSFATHFPLLHRDRRSCTEYFQFLSTLQPTNRFVWTLRSLKNDPCSDLPFFGGVYLDPVFLLLYRPSTKCRVKLGLPHLHRASSFNELATTWYVYLFSIYGVIC